MVAPKSLDLSISWMMGGLVTGPRQAIGNPVYGAPLSLEA